MYGPLDPRTEHLVSLLSTDELWSETCNISKHEYLQDIMRERRVWQTGLVFTDGEPVLNKVHSINYTELKRSKDMAKEGIVTLATQLTQERTSLISLIASQWEGPIVAVIEAHKSNISSVLDNLVKNMKPIQNRMQNIELLLVEKVSDLYPINWLRNLAQVHVKTEFIIHVDIDFIPNKGLYASLCDLSVNWSESEKKAVIIPAFDIYSIDNHSSVIPTIPESKKDLLLLMKNHTVEQFHINIYRCGHGFTNYPWWRKSQANYNIHTLKRKRKCYKCYEPYFMVRTSHSAFFPETLLHRGYNKVPSYGQLCQKGFTFEVLHDGFLLHKKHQIKSMNISQPFIKCAQRAFTSFVNYTRFHGSDQ